MPVSYTHLDVYKRQRSTVGTTTEVYDYLRLLYARAGEALSLIHIYIAVLGFLDLLWCDAVLFVVLQLLLATAVCLVDGQLHACRLYTSMTIPNSVSRTSLWQRKSWAGNRL